MEIREFLQKLKLLPLIRHAAVPADTDIPPGFQVDFLVLLRLHVCLIRTIVAWFYRQDDIESAIYLILQQIIHRLRMNMGKQ